MSFHCFKKLSSILHRCAEYLKDQNTFSTYLLVDYTSQYNTINIDVSYSAVFDNIQIVFSCPRSGAQCTYLCRLIQSRALSRDNAANGSLGNLLSLKSRDLSDEATFLKWKTWICTSIFLNHNNYYRVLHMDTQVFMWNTLYESMYSYHGHLWILSMHIWRHIYVNWFKR